MAPLSISFVGDLPGQTTDDIFVLALDADYVRVAALLRDNFASDFRAIWVRREHHFKWLESLINHGELRSGRPFTFARTTPQLLLGERWGLEIPTWLTNELILEEKLLDSPVPAGFTDVASALLHPYFGQLSSGFPAARAGFLVAKASEAEIAKTLASPVAGGAWQALLAGWERESSRPWVKSYCERLKTNPRKLWSDLTVWRLLSRYPESALDYALDPAAAAFVRTVPLDVIREMTLSPEGRRLAIDQTEPIFESANASPVTHTKFRALLDATSGELVEEFAAIESLLGRAGFDVTASDAAEARLKFMACPGISPARISRLGLFVRPPRPIAPPTANDAEAWVRWSLDQYMPYRWWQIERRFFDPDVEQFVKSFSEWYCVDYPQVHGDASKSAVQTLSQWRESILKDRYSLILLVDNLPWFFWDLLEKALSETGLHRHETGAAFVPLPSHTSVCKPLIVAGKKGASGSDYLKMLSVRSAEEWNSRPVHYLSGVDQLASLHPAKEPAVFLLNYLAADEALHSDAEASGSSWAEQLALLYRNLARAVGDFARQVSGQSQDIGIYILTDHGSTFVLPEERLAGDAKLSAKLFPSEKYRSATLTESDADEIPENLWALGHRFVSPFAAGVHFIPSGHNTVASPGLRPIFCHGGATPEEVIVPHGVFRLYPASWSAPRLRFLGIDLSLGHARFYIKRIVPLTVKIQNNNSEEMRLETVYFTPTVGEVRAFNAVTIPAKGSQATEVSLYFSNEAIGVSNIVFDLTFRVGQDAISQKIDLPVKISSAASGGIDLTKL